MNYSFLIENFLNSSENKNFFNLIFETASTAILDVMSWVVLTILIFEIINFLTKESFYKRIENTKFLQPFYGSFLGALPGCSGPIILTGLYNKRKIKLGALTAGLIATFGDASFVIIAFSLKSFLVLFLISFFVGIIFGYLIDFTPLGKKIQTWIDKEVDTKVKVEKTKPLKKNLNNSFVFFDSIFMNFLFMTLILIVFPATIMNLFTSVEIAKGQMKNYMIFSEWLSLFMCIIFIFYYFFIFILKKYYYFEKSEDQRNVTKLNENTIVKKKIKDKKTYPIYKIFYETFTNGIFILTWVFFGLFLFSLVLNPFADKMGEFFQNRAIGLVVSIFLGVLVGMLPGCGPQIAFANLYTSGVIGFAAIAANSINQDGDAEFPLMATEKRTFFVMVFLNLIPALVTGFLVLFFSWALGNTNWDPALF